MKVSKLLAGVLAAGAVLFLLVAPAAAQLRVDEPWVRATVPQQKATGAFMRITSDRPARLTGVSSPVAGAAEFHEMIMEGEVMKMRPLAHLDLPAGKTVELRPGANHLMLLDLKAPVKEGEFVPITLTVEIDGRRETVKLDAPVRNLAHLGKH